METELLDKLNSLEESKTDVLQKALELYLQKSGECNTPINRSVDAECNTKRNTDVNTINKAGQNVEHEISQVNHSVQIVENYELLRHYKEEIDWLRDRVEYFEGACKDLQHNTHLGAKSKKEAPSISLYRM